MLLLKLTLVPAVLGPMLLTPLLIGANAPPSAVGYGLFPHFFAQFVVAALFAAALKRTGKHGPSALRLGYAAPLWLAAVLGVAAKSTLVDLEASSSDSLDRTMQLKLALWSQVEGFSMLVHLGAGLSAALFVLALLWLLAPAPPAARAARTGARWPLPAFAGLFAAALIAISSQREGYYVAPFVAGALSLAALVLGAASSCALWRSDRHAEPTRAGGEALWAATCTSFAAALSLVAASHATDRAAMLQFVMENAFEELPTALDIDRALIPHTWPISGFTLTLSLLAALPVLLAAVLHHTPEDEARPLTPVLVRGALIGCVLPLGLLITLGSAVYNPQLRERPAAIAAARLAFEAELAEQVAAERAAAERAAPQNEQP